MPATIPATAELILHIGAAKTGSSAVQHYFCTHAEEIGRKGVHYPVHPLDPNGRSGGHVEITSLVLAKRAAEAGQAVRAYLDTARQAGRRLFLSSETFMPYAAGLSGMLPCECTHVVCIVRHPLDALASHYNQRVKRYFMKDRLQQVVRAILSTRHQNPVLSGTALFDWLDWCGRERMTVVPYVQSGKVIDATASMLALLGLPPAAEGMPAVNCSYTPAAVEFKLLANNLPPELLHPFDEALDRSLQTYSDARAVAWPVIEEFLDEDEAAAIERHFQPDVDRIAETFGIAIERLRRPPRDAAVVAAGDSVDLVWEHVSGDERLVSSLRNAVATAAAMGDADDGVAALARIVGASHS